MVKLNNHEELKRTLPSAIEIGIGLKPRNLHFVTRRLSISAVYDMAPCATQPRIEDLESTTVVNTRIILQH